MCKNKFSIFFIIILFFLFSNIKVKADDIIASLSTSVHLENIGWTDPVNINEQSSSSDNYIEIGSTSEYQMMDQLKISSSGFPDGAFITTAVYVDRFGWFDPAGDGEVAGSFNYPDIRAIRISLINAPNYTIEYCSYIQGQDWLDWVSNGQDSGTDDKSGRIQALRIKLIKNDTSSSLNNSNLLFDGINYSTYSTTTNWSTNVSDAGLSGDIQSNTPITAFKVSLQNVPDTSNVTYSSLNKNGWSVDSSSGNISGNMEDPSPIYAIKISTDSISKTIAYQVYILNIGWSDWFQNGTIAGDIDTLNPIVAIRITLLDNTNLNNFPPDIDTNSNTTSKIYNENPYIAIPIIHIISTTINTENCIVFRLSISDMQSSTFSVFLSTDSSNSFSKVSTIKNFKLGDMYFCDIVIDSPNNSTYKFKVIDNLNSTSIIHKVSSNGSYIFDDSDSDSGIIKSALTEPLIGYGENPSSDVTGLPDGSVRRIDLEQQHMRLINLTRRIHGLKNITWTEKADEFALKEEVNNTQIDEGFNNLDGFYIYENTLESTNENIKTNSFYSMISSNADQYAALFQNNSDSMGIIIYQHNNNLYYRWVANYLDIDGNNKSPF